MILGKKKATYIENILRRVATTHTQRNEIEQVKRYIESKFFPDPAPIHNLYREYFNLVDLMDRHWYEVKESHPNPKWKSKFLLSIMRFFVINSWVWYTQENYETWKYFHINLAEELIDL